jgi:hypothetical protein
MDDKPDSSAGSEPTTPPDSDRSSDYDYAQDTAFSRSMRGSLIGAGIGAAAGAGVILLFLCLTALLSNDQDQVHYFLCAILPSAVVGSLIGAIGGFAAHVPRRGLSPLRGVGIVAAAAVVVVWIAQSTTLGDQHPWLLLLALLIAPAAIVLYGIARSTVANKEGAKPTSEHPQRDFATEKTTANHDVSA